MSLQEGIQTDADARDRQKSARWDLERHTKGSTGGGETKQKINLPQGSGWRKMGPGQEEPRCSSSDPDVPGLLAGFWLSFPLELSLSPKRRARLMPPVGPPELCHRSVQGDRRWLSAGWALALSHLFQPGVASSPREVGSPYLFR